MSLVLNQADRDSGLWQRLKKHLEHRRDVLRKKNDSPLLDERATAEVRGRLAQLKELLALDSPAPGVDP